MPVNGAVYALLVAAVAAAACVAAVFRRALDSASLARLEEINRDQQRYGELPDMRRARAAAGAVKLILYAALVVLISGRIEAAAAGASSYAGALALSVAAVLAMEAVALVIAGYHSGRALYAVLPVVAVFSAAGRALLAAGSLPTAVIARLVGRRAPPAHDESVEEEILDAVTEGEIEGVIEDREREMIESIIEFKDSEVSGIMTPRTGLKIVAENMTLREATAVAVESAHSRLPVAAENADNIVGILHVKDLLPHIGTERQVSMRVREVMRAPYFVPKTKRIRELLQEFRATNIHMAIVLDEYVGTAGLVTIEDVLEEIVGEIQDEYDVYEPPEIRVTGAGRAVVAGTAKVHDVNQALGASISEAEEYETVAGFILYRLGRIPRPGEAVSVDAMRFRILDADERRIKRMAVAVADQGIESRSPGSA